MECPKCKSINYTKDGIVKSKQRYRCKECNYRYTVNVKSTSKPEDMKRQALHLYLEGLGFRSIGRFLKVSHVSIQQWIKRFGKGEMEIKTEKNISVVEMDELHTYIGSKKTTAGYGLLLIEIGKGSSNVFLVAEGLKPE